MTTSLALLIFCSACNTRSGRSPEARRRKQRPNTRLAAEGVPHGRLLLRDSAARRLGLGTRELREVDSLRVPLAVRRQADELRGAWGGDSASVVRYYAGAGGQLAVLVPTRSFEGEDPHAVVAFGPDGSALARLALSSYEAVEVYCPASGPTHPGASSRDSTDGCRYFHPVPVGSPMEADSSRKQ